MLDTKQATFLSSSDNFSEIARFVKKVGTNPTVRNKTARFGVPVSSAYVAKRRPILLPYFSRRSRASALTEREVSICGDLLTLMRTYFESRSD